MGGSRASDTDLPSNLIRLCGSGTVGCHGQIEANRRAATTFGLLVRQGEISAQVPVKLAVGHVFLTDTGTYEEVS